VAPRFLIDENPSPQLAGHLRLSFGSSSQSPTQIVTGTLLTFDVL